MAKLCVTKLDNLNTLIIKQEDGKGFFISSSNSIVISINSLAFLLSFLVKNGFLSPKVLEGILEEFNSTDF